MIVEEFLLLALALVYTAISYGQSPRESGLERQNEMDRKESRGR